MTALASTDGLTREQLLRIVARDPALLAAASRDAMRDKSYQSCPIGQEIAGYLRAKKLEEDK